MKQFFTTFTGTPINAQVESIGRLTTCETPRSHREFKTRKTPSATTIAREVLPNHGTNQRRIRAV
jgi:hypothetical protein